ncbi:MAG: hypothetical protein JWO97_545 [Acidobacteria bacterium]|nr:hypothetical protein [Acidobacteriota bacterium]
MSAATAMVQIVGLYLIANGVLPGGHLAAIAPRIPCPSAAIQSRGDTGEKAMNLAGVEEHAAILVFSACDYRSSSGWTVAPLETQPGKLYVQLDGELITFRSGLSGRFPIDRTAIKTSARRITLPNDAPSAVVDLGLPHVQGQCCAQPVLRPEYLPPDYKLAAAVVDLSNGRANSCMVGGRADTVVNIDNDGTLTIEGTKGQTKKLLTLDGSAFVVFANVPTDATTGRKLCPATAPHYNAYAAMLQACSKPVECPISSAHVPACKEGPQLITIDGGAGTHTHDTAHRLNAECSNNQWP